MLPNPLTPQPAVDAQPLRNSAAPSQIEAELKSLFIDLIDAHIRPGERAAATLAIPHVGPRDLFDRAVKSEGIALYRSTPDDADEPMRYVLEAWRARNPKRGLAMLRAYLQLIWPGQWRCNQLWQDKGKDYPLGLAEADQGNHFLTSRVLVEISTQHLHGASVEQIAQALRSVVPARILLEVSAILQFELAIGIHAAATTGLMVQQFEGVATADGTEITIQGGAHASSTGLTVQYFEGAARADVYGSTFETAIGARPTSTNAVIVQQFEGRATTTETWFLTFDGEFLTFDGEYLALQITS